MSKPKKHKFITLQLGFLIIVISGLCVRFSLGDCIKTKVPALASLGFCNPPSLPFRNLIRSSDANIEGLHFWHWYCAASTASRPGIDNQTISIARLNEMARIVHDGRSEVAKMARGMSEFGKAVVIDHKCININHIPIEWISKAKQTLHISYGHSSHGSQLTTGMAGLVKWKGELYAWNNRGTGGTLDFRNYYYNFGRLGIANDLGTSASWTPDRTAWDRATRAYLPLHPEINVIIWAWCWQANGSEAEIKLYLNLMNQLEIDYPNVKFVYMTGHVNGGPLTGRSYSSNLAKRNQQIRDYCLAHNKILYDFADIESWDPDGNYFGDKLVDADCSYDSNGDGTRDRNWAIDWQNGHPGEWYNCEAAHTQPLNANLKAYAAWWLWARLAGWDGR